MNFYDTVTEMGYKVKKEPEHNNIIHIIKEDDRKPHVIEIHILFDKEDKLINGFLKPCNLFYNMDDMVLIYKFYREMQADLKYLATRSNYEIV